MNELYGGVAIGGIRCVAVVKDLRRSGRSQSFDHEVDCTDSHHRFRRLENNKGEQ